MLKRGDSSASNDLQQVRDIFGRTVSYHLARCPSVLEHDIAGIDPYAQDWESGYSALHICLMTGQYQKAFGIYWQWRKVLSADANLQGSVLDLKDREGFTPLRMVHEMHNFWNLTHIPESLSVVETPKKCEIVFTRRLKEPRMSIKRLREWHAARGGRRCYTFGKNDHFQLGTGDSKARQVWYEVRPDDFEDRIDAVVRIRSSHMSKRHAIIVGSDGSIYCAGRLSRGLHSEISHGTVKLQNFYFEPMKYNADGDVCDVASSNTHNIFLTADSKVYTWGWNDVLQLGYPSDGSSHPFVKHVPLGLKDVAYVSCSTIHSAVITNSGALHSWGLNIGQMSTYRPATQAIDSSGEHLGWKTKRIAYETQCQNIKQLICCEYATLIRYDDYKLCVITDFKRYRFTLADQRSSASDFFNVFRPSRPADDLSIVKICTKHPYGNNLCVLYNNGCVGIVRKPVKDGPPGKQPLALEILPYWTPSTWLDRCVDFDVGMEGELVVCTIGGEVYLSKGPNQGFKHQKAKPPGGKCVRVSCDPLFASFSVIIDEFDIPRTRVGTNAAKYAAYSPAHQMVEWYHVTETRAPALPTVKSVLYTAHYFHSANNSYSHAATELPANCFGQAGPQHEGKVIFPPYNFSDFKPVETYDVAFIDSSGRTIGACHKAVLCSRCPQFVNKLVKDGDEGGQKITPEINFRLLSRLDAPVWLIHVDDHTQNWTFHPILYALHLLYDVSDFNPPPSLVERDAFLKKGREFSMIFGITAGRVHVQSAFRELHRQCESDGSETCSIPSCHFHSHSYINLEQYMHPDIEIELCNSKRVFAHAFVLQNKSPFFDGLLRSKWHRGKVVRLMHVEEHIFRIILKYMYGFSSSSLFDDLRATSITEQAESLFDLVETCNELLLLELRSYADYILAGLITHKTVLPLLVNGYSLGCSQLFTCCAYYLFHNPELLFHDPNIGLIHENVSPDCWANFEDICRQLQTGSSTFGHDEHLIYGTPAGSDWFHSFRTDISRFNSLFIDRSNPFQIVPDIKKKKSKAKKSVPRAIAEVTECSATPQRPVRSSTSQSSPPAGDTSAPSAFTPVSKGKRRPLTCTNPQPTIEVAAQSGSSTNFARFEQAPATQPRARLAPFKKPSQKQRIEQHLAATAPQPQQTSATPWSSVAGPSQRSTPARNSKFPALSDVVSSGTSSTGTIGISTTGHRRTITTYLTKSRSSPWQSAVPASPSLSLASRNPCQSSFGEPLRSQNGNTSNRQPGTARKAKFKPIDWTQC
ncbi:AaceriAFR536Wp [[Ashbya] aceris (nom. inval.)]|nr:AaceriAFR536Wp [[Ashbya] aceris (nom. inval.)]